MIQSSSKASVGPLFRFCAHLRDWLIRCSPLRVHTRSGHELRVWDRTQLRLYEQVFVERVFPLQAAFERLGTEEPVILDVGCNSGMFSMAALDYWPRAQIHAFEPQQDLVRRFSTVLGGNGLTGKLTLNRAAVGGECAEGELFRNRSSISASLLKPKVAKRRIIARETVPVITLDHYVAERKLDRIDLLKLDVEGAELSALAGAAKVLSTVRILFVEVHPPFATAEAVEAVCRQHHLLRMPTWERSATNCHDLVFVRSDLR